MNKLERHGFDLLSSSSFQHILSFLEVSEKIQFLSSSQTLGKEGWTSCMETFCGKCDEFCRVKLQHLCSQRKERMWSTQVWTTIIKRFGHAIQELHLAGCDGISAPVFQSDEAYSMLKNLRVLSINRCKNMDSNTVCIE